MVVATHRGRAWRCASIALLLAAGSMQAITAQQATPQGLLNGPFITLAWDPSSDPAVTGYVVYVGTASGQYTKIYDAGNRTSFVYPYAELNRRYYFALASYGSGTTVGRLSPEVSGTGRAVPPPGYPFSPVSELAATATQLRATSALSSSTPCSAPSATDCLDARVFASRRGQVNAVAATNDGRVWFIENSREVYTIGRQGGAQLALTARGEGIQLSGLVLGPNYDRTRRLFIEEIEYRPDGTRELTIASYRELANTLGDRVAIVTGIQLPATGEAPFAIDAAGRMYIALPGHADGVERYTGAVLAFEADGTSLRGNRGASPILSRGFSRPTAIQLSTDGTRLWLSGTDTSSVPPLASVSARPSEGWEWPAAPRAAVLVANPPRLTRGTDTRERAPMMLLPVPTGRVVRIDQDANTATTTSLENIQRLAPGPPLMFYGVTSAEPTGSGLMAIRAD